MDAANNNNVSRCKLFDVDKDEEKLSYKKKIAMFEDDMETLYEFALSKGYSCAQIRACFSPMLGGDSSFGKRMVQGSWRSMVILSVVVATIAVLWSVPATKDLIGIHAKLLSVKSLPIYDWSQLWNEECLINNPFREEEKMSREDCAQCSSDFEGIETINNKTDPDVVSHKLRFDAPFIASDATKDWPRNNKSELVFSVERLSSLLKKHNILTTSVMAADCEFMTSLGPSEKYNIVDFVETFLSDSLPEQFHAAWDNCDANGAKVFRMMARRPYFFPAFAEASKENQIILARGKYTEEKFHIPQSVRSASVLTVIQGSVKVYIEPHEECVPFECKGDSFLVGPGEAAVVPTRIWKVDYSPISEGYTLGYATTLFWDE